MCWISDFYCMLFLVLYCWKSQSFNKHQINSSCVPSILSVCLQTKLSVGHWDPLMYFFLNSLSIPWYPFYRGKQCCHLISDTAYSHQWTTPVEAVRLIFHLWRFCLHFWVVNETMQGVMYCTTPMQCTSTGLPWWLLFRLWKFLLMETTLAFLLSPTTTTFNWVFSL